MEPKAHYALVGFFAIALTAAVVVFVLWLGQLRFDQEFAEYDIVFDGAARGLREASEVQFNGIQVGEVTRIALAGREGERVIARVRVNAVTPVSCESLGRLEPLGITGVNYIQLLPRDGAPPPPSDEETPARTDVMVDPRDQEVDFSACTPPGESTPRIRGEQSAIDALFEGSGGVVTETQELVALLSRELDANALNIRATLAELRGTMEEVGAHDELLLDQVETAMFQINERIVEVGETIQLTNELVRTTNQMMINDIAPTMASLRTTAETAAEVMTSVNEVVQDGRGPAVESIEQLAVAMAELRTLIARIDSIAREIEENPAGFVSGGTAPREVEIPQ